MSAQRTKKKARQRTHRYTSNVFSMFDQGQIQEFKEAFNMIDQNRDGFVDREDLIEMLTSLGKTANDDYVEDMIREAPGPLNFTMFLTLFGEKLNGTDPEDVIMNAFACFDPKHTGTINEDTLREVMTTMGDRWTDSMVDELFHTAPITNSAFDYGQFIKNLKHGHKDKDETSTASVTAPPTATEQQKPETPTAPKPPLKQPAPKPAAPAKQPVSVLKKAQAFKK